MNSDDYSKEIVEWYWKKEWRSERTESTKSTIDISITIAPSIE